jgi:hypothetical protein
VVERFEWSNREKSKDIAYPGLLVFSFKILKEELQGSVIAFKIIAILLIICGVVLVV